ncbi:hypothetical protein [Streptomyces arboris]|uniref:hypothetical protein n=1 Tax=Streptomyces arboris TaxID=2600619 RepID=UPI0036387AD0
MSPAEAGLTYLLGSGREGAKLPKAEQELSGSAAYFAQGTERGAPLATWIGAGVQSFGLSEGGAATERDIRIIFGKHAHPVEYRAAMAAALAKIEAEGLSGTAAEKLMAEAEKSSSSWSVTADEAQMFCRPPNQLEDHFVRSC